MLARDVAFSTGKREDVVHACCPDDDNKASWSTPALCWGPARTWSGDGVSNNRDAGLLIYDPAAAYYEQIFLHDWTNLAIQQACPEGNARLLSRPEMATVRVPIPHSGGACTSLIGDWPSWADPDSVSFAIVLAWGERVVTRVSSVVGVQSLRPLFGSLTHDA